MHYDATEASLRQHPLPPWFADAKLGFLIHWGPDSVPAWAERSGTVQELWSQRGPAYFLKHNPYAEWYANTMLIPGSATQRHHLETYGSDFAYDDFVPQFSAASAQADFASWADLFARAGARYVVLTTKHHDGYLLWPSRRPPPKPAYASPHDIVGGLSEAVRARGLKMGLYYSGGYDKLFNPTVIRSLPSAVSAIPQSSEYAEYCDAHISELIERYQPSVLWNDIAYPATSDLKTLLAHYYNSVGDGAVNDRWTQFRLPRGLRRAALFTAIRTVAALWPALPKSWRRLQMQARFHHDFSTHEYETYADARAKKWEACRGLGLSFGNNRLEDDSTMLSPEALVHLLVDVVSKNGNLMLGIAPDASGVFPETQRRRLLALGDWLLVHGEAVFDTRPWLRAEGTTVDGLPVRFTRNDGAVYALVLGPTAGPSLAIDRLAVAPGARVHLLGHAEALTWRSEAGRLAVDLPGGLPPSPARAVRVAPAEAVPLATKAS